MLFYWERCFIFEASFQLFFSHLRYLNVLEEKKQLLSILKEVEIVECLSISLRFVIAGIGLFLLFVQDSFSDETLVCFLQQM